MNHGTLIMTLPLSWLSLVYLYFLNHYNGENNVPYWNKNTVSAYWTVNMLAHGTYTVQY